MIIIVAVVVFIIIVLYSWLNTSLVEIKEKLSDIEEMIKEQKR